MFTPSQIIAALIEKLGGEPVTLTVADVIKWQTKYPTLLTLSEDQSELTVEISPATSATNQQLK